ncbi:MAG: dicarboxylate/amino acid:cation symporter [Gammaproteobacteria bacterium]|jgi:Na+/H+-dicarboxylate symporter|nr:dicarboxylate/amino acid:cation symporter [Gammaproteobacteria bacterium]MDP6732099.1 dicarboxylate/amino acid:cation symporter [Gammaproteobacteria bacterium]
MKLSTKILLGLALGLVSGITYSLIDQNTLGFVPGLIEPVGSLWVNAIRMTVIPLLMALLVTAIAGQHTSSRVATLGGKTIALFVIMILASALLALLVAPPLIALLDIDPAASQALLQSTGTSVTVVSELPPFRDWLVGLIPANPFAAAVDDAILPLLIFTGLFSVALLQVSEQHRQIVVNFFAAIKDAMFVLIAWIMAVAPIGIFALVFPLAATLGLSAITVLGSFIFIVCSLIVALILILYPLARFGAGIPLRKFARTVAPAQAIGFSTRSSLASLPATYAATELLGIPEKVSGLVLPVAVTLFKYASPLARTTGTYFIASLYGIDLNFGELGIIALAIGLLSFYSPGIPSGGLLIMAPVYLSLGLPVEGIGILIAIDLIVDMFLTAANVTANVTATALLAGLHTLNH